MNEGLLKSFDNLMYQQTKMDNKAYIFIGFLVILSKVFKENNQIIWLLIIIAIPFIISLIPIANKFTLKLMNIFFTGKNLKKLNIFYYLDMYRLEHNDFIELFKKEYDEQTISRYDEKLIEQILINAKILRCKVFWHNISYRFAFVALLIFLIIYLVVIFKMLILNLF